MARSLNHSHAVQVTPSTWTCRLEGGWDPQPGLLCSCCRYELCCATAGSQSTQTYHASAVTIPCAVLMHMSLHARLLLVSRSEGAAPPTTLPLLPEKHVMCADTSSQLPPPPSSLSRPGAHPHHGKDAGIFDAQEVVRGVDPQHRQHSQPGHEAHAHRPQLARRRHCRQAHQGDEGESDYPPVVPAQPGGLTRDG